MECAAICSGWRNFVTLESKSQGRPRRLSLRPLGGGIDLPIHTYLQLHRNDVGVFQVQTSSTRGGKLNLFLQPGQLVRLRSEGARLWKPRNGCFWLVASSLSYWFPCSYSGGDPSNKRADAQIEKLSLTILLAYPRAPQHQTPTGRRIRRLTSRWIGPRTLLRSCGANGAGRV